MKFFFTFTCLLFLNAAYAADIVILEIQALKDNPAFTNAQYSVYAKYKNGPALADVNASARLSPASILKLYTSAAVLDALGPDYIFETKIYYSGVRKGSKINGDIYIKGGGDPSLGSNRVSGTPSMEELVDGWVLAFKEAGIEKITGSIYADNTIFSGIALSWRTSYQNIGNYFAAPSDGLSIADNSYNIYFEPADEFTQTPAILKIDPPLPNLIIKNNVAVSMAVQGENVYVNSVPGSSFVELYGTISPSSKPLRVAAAMPSPALFLASYFREKLEEADIKVKGGAALNTPLEGYDEDRLLLTHKSPPLKELVTYTNKRSINLYADTFLRNISAVKNNIGSLSDGVSELNNYLASLQVPTDNFEVYDGSGLARDNITTCKTTVDLLEKVSDKPYWEVFFNSLPIVGDGDDIGNMSHRLKHSSAAHNAHIKTGTLDRVRSHAGYITDSKGRQIIFCIITNNFYGPLKDVDAAHESVINALADIGLNTKPKRKTPEPVFLKNY